MPETRAGNRWILVITDHFTRWQDGGKNDRFSGCGECDKNDGFGNNGCQCVENDGFGNYCCQCGENDRLSSCGEFGKNDGF